MEINPLLVALLTVEEMSRDSAYPGEERKDITSIAEVSNVEKILRVSLEIILEELFVYCIFETCSENDFSN